MIRKLLHNWFTGTNNVEYELGRALWALSFLAMIIYQGYAIYKGQTFDALQFGGGVGAILAAGGMGVAVKDKARASALQAENANVSGSNS